MRQEAKIRNLKNSVRQLSGGALERQRLPIASLFVSYGGLEEARELLEAVAENERDGMWWYVYGLSLVNMDEPVAEDVEKAASAFGNAISMGLRDASLMPNLITAKAVADELYRGLVSVTDTERNDMSSFMSLAYSGDWDRNREKAIEKERSISDIAASFYQRQFLIVFFNHNENEEAESLLARVEKYSSSDSRAVIWHFFRALFHMKALDERVTIENLERNLKLSQEIRDEARKCHEAVEGANIDDETIEAVHKLLDISRRLRISMRTAVRSGDDYFIVKPYIPEHSPIS